MTIFDYNYLYSAYADDTTFFLKDIISVKDIISFHFFSYFSGLKPNLTKSEIAGIGVLKGKRGSSGSLWYALYRSEC